MDEKTKSSDLKSTGYELFILLLSLVSIYNLAIDVFGGFLDMTSNLDSLISKNPPNTSTARL